jgi:ATP synthase protein I
MASDDDKRNGGLKDFVTAESMVQLALAITRGCLAGWAIGSWLDHHFHQSWMMITGIVLGAVGGFIQIYRTAAGFIKRDQ